MLLVIVYVTDEFVPVKRPDRLNISEKKIQVYKFS